MPTPFCNQRCIPTTAAGPRVLDVEVSLRSPNLGLIGIGVMVAGSGSLCRISSISAFFRHIILPFIFQHQAGELLYNIFLSGNNDVISLFRFQLIHDYYNIINVFAGAVSGASCDHYYYIFFNLSYKLFILKYFVRFGNKLDISFT